MKYFLLSSSLLIAFFATGQQSQKNWFCNSNETSIEKVWVETDLGRQKVLLIHAKEQKKSDALIIFLHGDSPFRDPIYQYNIARQISEMAGVTAAAILRPGYKDNCGDQSGGDKGRTMGDNYTQENVDAIAAVIQNLQQRLNPTKTIIMGHSGGAALTALLAQSLPTLAQQSILIACPCDLPEWRKVMLKLTQFDQWSQPMPGLSPLDGLDQVDTHHKTQMYVGMKDVVAPPFLSKTFYDQAVSKKLNIDIQVIEGADHENILADRLLQQMIDEVDF